MLAEQGADGDARPTSRRASSSTPHLGGRAPEAVRAGRAAHPEPARPFLGPASSSTPSGDGSGLSEHRRQTTPEQREAKATRRHRCRRCAASPWCCHWRKAATLDQRILMIQATTTSRGTRQRTAKSQIGRPAGRAQHHRDAHTAPEAGIPQLRRVSRISAWRKAGPGIQPMPW